MKPYFFRLSCILAVCLLFSCSERRPIGRNADARYIEDSSEKGLVNLGKINSQDFTRAANKLLQDLFTTGALSKAPDQPAILHVGEVRNDTQTYFDTDLLLQGMKRDLLASNRVRISTTEGSKTTDQYAKGREGQARTWRSFRGLSSPSLFLPFRKDHRGNFEGGQGDAKRFLLSNDPDGNRIRLRCLVWQRIDQQTGKKRLDWFLTDSDSRSKKRFDRLVRGEADLAFVFSRCNASKMKNVASL